jgi:hypothetical protein
MKDERIEKGRLKRSSQKFGELYPVLYSEDEELREYGESTAELDLQDENVDGD